MSRLLWRSLGQPGDAFFFDADDCVMFDVPPLVIESDRAYYSSNDSQRRVAQLSAALVMQLGSSTVTHVEDMQSVSTTLNDWLRKWGLPVIPSVAREALPLTTFCVKLPPSIAMLLIRRQWRSIVVLARWLQRRKRSTQIADGWRLFPDFPSDSWLAAAKAEDHAVTSRTADEVSSWLRPAKIRKVADTIRRACATELPVDSEASGEEYDINDMCDDLPTEARNYTLEVAESCRWLDDLADNLERSGMVQTRVRGYSYTATSLITCFRLAGLLRGEYNLVFSMCLAIDVAAPPVLRAHLKDSLLRKNPQTGRIRHISRETARKYKLFIDVSMMMLMYSSHDLDAAYWFEVDSSPQAGYDWLIISYSSVLLEHLDEVFKAVHQLANIEHDGDSDHDGDSRAHWGEVLCRCIKLHMCPPVALGLGASGLADKIHAFLWALALECRSLVALRQVLAGIVSFCTDMGVELGFADAPNIDLGKHLARCGMHRAGRLEQDVIEVELGAGRRSEYLFDFAVGWAGLLHVTGNLAKELSLNMFSKWGEQQKMLKEFNNFVCKSYWMDRFKERCLRGTPGETFIKRLNEKQFTKIIDWRFLVVFDFLDEVLPFQFLFTSYFYSARLQF